MAPSRPTSHFAVERVADDLALYNDGAIVYMYFENFITYDRCECYPGPFMNMIMGPNGSGKSSVVAAMVLGLGWHPTVLGRSKDVAEFIKYGRERAVLEIGLKVTGRVLREVEAPREDGILLLRREILRSRASGKLNTHHSSEWYVNGQNVGARLIMSVMRALDVQIDNLCQFLPQDKVSEFAKLTPAELLLETEKAAAPSAVHEQHTQLIELRARENEMMAKLEDQTRKLATLSKQNETLDTLIQRIHEREQHLRMIKLCERKRPFLVYARARDAYEEVRRQRDEARAELERAEETFSPLKMRLREGQETLRTAERKRGKMIEKTDRLKKEIDGLLTRELEKITVDIDCLKAQIFKLREQRTRREASIAELHRVIRQLEQETTQQSTLSQQQRQEEEERYRTDLKRVNEAMDEVERALSEAEGQEKLISREGQRLQREIDQMSVQLREVEDVKGMRLEQVRRMAPDVAEAYRWIQSHRDAFREPVYGPICLDVNLKDTSVARQVESVLSKSTLLTFVVTTAEDLETLQRQLCDTMRLNVNMTLVEPEGGNGDAHGPSQQHTSRSELDRGELKRLGFRGTVLDLIEAPPAVITVLMDVAKIHLIPIAKQSVDSERAEALGARLQRYATPDGCFEIRMSKYTDDKAVRCTQLKPSLFFAQSAGEERKQMLVEHITEIRSMLAQNSEKMKRILQEKAPLEKRRDVLKGDRDRVGEQRRAWLEVIAEAKRKRNLLDLKRGNLQELLAADRGSNEQQEETTKQQLKLLFIKHTDTSLKAAELAGKLKELAMTISVEFLSIALLEGEVVRLKDKVQANEFRFEGLRTALSETETHLAEKKSAAKELLERAMRDELDEETREAFAQLPELLDELDRLLMIERTKAEVSGNDPSVSMNILREFETRKVTITELQDSTEGLRGQIKQLADQMQGIHEQWQPAVEQMARAINERFSAFFAQMQCAGEVRVAPVGRDYSHWSLEILVRFRDNETMQVLSAQRQSGGEKSVATILFLLALQELTRSPFRVVDEINQGMDANNERSVHALIVETATRASHSQYFLITPKLLTGLQYHDRMQVLCVFNGEGIPSMAA